MLIFLSVVENIVVLCHRFLLFSPVEPRTIFIMPGHYRKIMPAQQPIRVRVLL